MLLGLFADATIRGQSVPHHLVYKPMIADGRSDKMRIEKSRPHYYLVLKDASLGKVALFDKHQEQIKREHGRI